MTNPAMKHVSIDLETMSSDSGAAIVQIGAYIIQGMETEPDPERLFKRNVDLESCLKYGLRVSGDTVMWWLQQSDAARQSLVDPKPVRLLEALIDLNDWFRNHAVKDAQVWSHASFDAAILGHAYKATGVKPVWLWRNLVDLRTLRHFPTHRRPDMKKGHALEHDAGWDAFAQGQDVAHALAAVQRANALLAAEREAMTEMTNQ